MSLQQDSDKNNSRVKSTTPLKQANGIFRKPVFSIVAGLFILAILFGYWIGSTFILTDAERNSLKFPNILDITNTRTYAILEYEDLSVDDPLLISSWLVHLSNKEDPSLGFTPLAVKDIKNESFSDLYKIKTVDKNLIPTNDLINIVNKTGFKVAGFIMLDKVSSSAIINWFSGRDLEEPMEKSTHSMVEYGQILRSLCKSLRAPAERGNTDFPLTLFPPDHFSSTLQLTTTIKDITFLTSIDSPRCQMVPLP